MSNKPQNSKLISLIVALVLVALVGVYFLTQKPAAPTEAVASPVAATEVPATEAPKATDVPATEAPKATEVPATEAPKATDVPATEAPKATDVPATEAPKAEAPAATEVATAAAATEVAAAPAATEAAAVPAAKPYKIAVITGTTSQGEEEFRAAEKLKADYPGIVVTDTYPDNFPSEVETTIGKLLAFAKDPEVKAIIMVQAVQGATSAYTKIKQELKRDDILLITGVPAEDPADIAAASDVVMAIDELRGGDQIVNTAKNWGCDVLIHYSFARHMGYETIRARYELMKDIAKEVGIELIARDSLDPRGEGGMTAAQQFILEDVPKVMAEYPGKKVAFFSTNCGLQEPLQAAILKQPNAYYPLPCCPSPFHGFPASLAIEADANAYGNIPEYLKKEANKLKEYDAVGRFSTWAVPVNMSMIYGGFDYATRYINGEFAEKNNPAELIKSLSTVTGGAEVKLTPYEASDGKVLDNYLLILFDNVDFSKYLGN